MMCRCSTKVKYGEGAYASNDAAAFSLAATLQHPAGHTRTFSSKDMCASPARDYSYDPEVVHDVILTGLVSAQHDDTAAEPLLIPYTVWSPSPGCDAADALASPVQSFLPCSACTPVLLRLSKQDACR